MKNMVVALALCALASLSAPPAGLAQNQPAGSNWDRVQALPVGTALYVTSQKSTHHCTLQSVTADTLSCTQKKPGTYPRADIQTIKLTRKGASTAVAAGIGIGVGAGVGAAVDAGLSNTLLGGKKAKSALIGAALGGILIAPIGFATDFMRGPTVYRAP